MLAHAAPAAPSDEPLGQAGNGAAISLPAPIFAARCPGRRWRASDGFTRGQSADGGLGERFERPRAMAVGVPVGGPVGAQQSRLDDERVSAREGAGRADGGLLLSLKGPCDLLF